MGLITMLIDKIPITIMILLSTGRERMSWFPGFA